MRGKVRMGCWERGIAVLTCGPRSIRFRPPLIYTSKEADRTISVLRKVLKGIAG